MSLVNHSYSIRKYQSAKELPVEWDLLATGYFQKRIFLEHNDQFNYCYQRYYLLFDRQVACAGAVVYTLTVNLLTFVGIPSPFRMQVIGLPASVSPTGIFGERISVEYLIDYLLQEEKGIILGLNLSPDLKAGRGIKMRMLPTLEFDQAFHTEQEYVERLRYPYRRRYHQVLAKWKGIRTARSSCSAFTLRHYSLYREVLNRSQTKLETLHPEYFRNLPGNFYLTTYYLNREMLCWHINCRDQEEDKLYFFVGGHSYEHNKSFDAYFNNLIGVLKEGIDEGFSRIDFGQTAEIPKMRLGGKIIPKVLFIYHRNPILLFLFRKLRRLLEYRRALPEHHVFKINYQPATQYELI